MTLSETFITALFALRKNKVRAFLTMLGVIIGVFAVVTLVSLVQGIRNFVTDQFNNLGSNLIIVAPGRANFNSDPAVAFTNNKLKEKHVDLIEKDLDDYLVAVSPSIRVGKTIKHKTKTVYTALTGGHSRLDEIFDIELDHGRFYNSNEDRSRSNVIILGPKIADELFGRRDVVGEEVKIDNVTFEVIGVTVEKSASFDDRSFSPFGTIKQKLGVKNISSIIAKSLDAEEIDSNITRIEIAMLKDLDQDDFTVLSQKDILESIQSILQVLSLGLSGVAGISLLVGGIGIMNIMLVSVTERTNEIGLRKALGATPRNISTQFLIESVAISLTGGLIGLGLGYLVTFAIQSFVRSEIPLWADFLAIIFSITVGVIFGTYPAIKAGKKDPIEALRYE